MIIFVFVWKDRDFFELGEARWPHPFRPSIGDGFLAETFFDLTGKNDAEYEAYVSNNDLFVRNLEWTSSGLRIWLEK